MGAWWASRNGDKPGGGRLCAHKQAWAQRLDAYTGAADDVTARAACELAARFGTGALHPLLVAPGDEDRGRRGGTGSCARGMEWWATATAAQTAECTWARGLPGCILAHHARLCNVNPDGGRPWGADGSRWFQSRSLAGARRRRIVYSGRQVGGNGAVRPWDLDRAAFDSHRQPAWEPTPSGSHHVSPSVGRFPPAPFSTPALTLALPFSPLSPSFAHLCAHPDR